MISKKTVLKLGKFLVRWGIAVIGIWWVISKMSWHDHVWAVLPGNTMPTKDVRVANEYATDASNYFDVIDPRTGKQITITRGDVVNEPDRANYRIFGEGQVSYIVGVDLSPDLKTVRRLLLAHQPGWSGGDVGAGFGLSEL